MGTDYQNNPSQAWQSARGQLQHELPKSAFDTWVRDAKFVSFEDDTFVISAMNTYARDWLADRLTTTLSKLLTGIMNRPIEVQFVVHQGTPEEIPDEASTPRSTRPKLEIGARDYQTVYEQVVRPDRQVVVPGYFRRHIPVIGPKMAWMYLAFRQLAYQEGARSGTGSGLFSGKQVAALCGISDRTFWRRIKKEKTWSALSGLVARTDSEPQWQENELQRLPLQYEVAMTLPLTAVDAQSLSQWLGANIEQYDGAEGYSRLPVKHL